MRHKVVIEVPEEILLWSTIQSDMCLSSGRNLVFSHQYATFLNILIDCPGRFNSFFSGLCRKLSSVASSFLFTLLVFWGLISHLFHFTSCDHYRMTREHVRTAEFLPFLAVEPLPGRSEPQMSQEAVPCPQPQPFHPLRQCFQRQVRWEA